MEHDPKNLYQRWIDLYDQGAPDEALKLTAPGFVMVTPDDRSLGAAEAAEFVAQIKAYLAQMGMKRKTTVRSLHTHAIGPRDTLIQAKVDLAFTAPSGEVTTLPFLEIMHVGPEGIAFDAFAKLAESQGFF